MDDPRSSFSGHTSVGTRVEVSQLPPAHLTQLAGWGGFDGALAETLSTVGLMASKDTQLSTRKGKTTLWCIAPNRVLIASDQSFDLSGLASRADIVGLDLSHARIRIRVEGAGAADLLARLVPVDLSLSAFPPDTFVQTGLHHISVLIDRLSETCFEILVPRNWSRAIFDIIRVHLAL